MEGKGGSLTFTPVLNMQNVQSPTVRIKSCRAGERCSATHAAVCAAPEACTTPPPPFFSAPSSASSSRATASSVSGGTQGE